MEASWEHFPHGADMGVRGRGPTVDQAFEQAAIALTAVMTDPASIREALTVEFACAAPDLEVLLVDWLNALVYETAVNTRVFGRFEVSVSGAQLTARAFGEEVDPRRHDVKVEVKGATFTCLDVSHGQDGWVAQCVVDV